MKKEPDSDEWVKVATLKPTDLIYKVKDLPDKNMYFAVAAENAAGVGPAAETDKPVKPKYPAGMCYTQSIYTEEQIHLVDFS